MGHAALIADVIVDFPLVKVLPSEFVAGSKY